MPYKKTYRKRYTKPYRKTDYLGQYNRYVGAAAGTMALAHQVYKLKRLINVEQKFFDVTSASTLIPDGVGTIIQLTNIPQGDTDETRDGAQVKLTSWSFKAVCSVDPTIAANGVFLTVMLVEDKQTNQAIYTTATLMASTANVLGVVSALNLDNKFRFKVHKRWIFQLNTSSGPRKVLKFYKKFNNKMFLRFDNSTPAIADLTTKSLSLLVISNIATTEPQITFFNRLRYVDN